jgi:hypothetical protein
MLPDNTSWPQKAAWLRTLCEPWFRLICKCLAEVSRLLRNACEDLVTSAFGHYGDGKLALDIM